MAERAKEEEAIKDMFNEPERSAPPTPLFEELDADDATAKPSGGKCSQAASSSASAPRPGPYSAPKKTRLQSDAPDDLQLAMDIAAALAKDKEASNTLPAPETTGNINAANPASAGAGSQDAPADNVAPATPPTLG